MKKIFLGLAAIMMSTVMMAQNQGDLSVGGDLSLGFNSNAATTESGSTTTTTKSNVTTFGISPRVGYFVIDNLEVFAMAGVGITTSKPSDNLKSNSTAWNYGIGAAYYLPLMSNIYYAPALTLKGNSISTKAEVTYGSMTNTTTDSYNTFGVSLALGRFETRITDNVAINLNVASLSYSGYTQDDTKYSNFSFGLTLAPTVGLKYYFN